MLRTIGGLLVVFACCLVGSSLNANSYSLNTPLDFDLQPGLALRITNGARVPIVADCEIRLVARDNHSIYIRMLNGSGVVNGSTLKRGQAMTMSVYHTQLVPITASPDSDAEFTNLGPYAIKVSCTPRLK